MNGVRSDWSLAFDLLLAAAVLQGYFLGISWINDVPGPYYHLYHDQIPVQIGSLVVLVGPLPLLTGIWLRNSYRTIGEQLYQRQGGPVVDEKIEEAEPLRGGSLDDSRWNCPGERVPPQLLPDQHLWVGFDS